LIKSYNTSQVLMCNFNANSLTICLPTKSFVMYLVHSTS